MKEDGSFLKEGEEITYTCNAYEYALDTFKSIQPRPTEFNPSTRVKTLFKNYNGDVLNASTFFYCGNADPFYDYGYGFFNVAVTKTIPKWVGVNFVFSSGKDKTIYGSVCCVVKLKAGVKFSSEFEGTWELSVNE